jgi:hypothetical protein
MNSIPAYVYYIKHLPTGKFYYGSRYKHINKGILPEQDFWRNYFTSSKEIKKLIEDTGNSSFDYKIVYTDFDIDKCFSYEQTLIKEHISDPLCINKRYFDSVNGTTVFCTYGKTLSTKGKPKKESTKEKMRQSKLGIVHPRKTCEHCGRETTVAMFARWHGNNCKLKEISGFRQSLEQP